MLLLGIETSCDETAVAIVRDAKDVLANIVFSQIGEHRLYGGVVPEIASRRHIENIAQAADFAFADAKIPFAAIDAVAVTYAPGLIGALLAGVSFAKGLAYACQKPLIPVHHLRAHIAALYLSHPGLQPPFVSLVASGGHSHLVRVGGYTDFTVLGRAVDDAAGEAFDKVARALGLEYPGGPAIARLAENGDPNGYALPNPQTENPLDMSFSGLKTAVINLINQAAMKNEPLRAADMAASFQRRAVDMLATRLVETAIRERLPAALCGGVAVNRLLRERVTELAAAASAAVYFPEPAYCGDNAAMVAAQGYYEFLNGSTAALSLNAYASRDMTSG